ncbi:GNAT family N-acetyltransferase [Nocardioides daphniae]|nr:GNAT family N-acetyltransferase [Nocardioides daphniae]
MPWDRTRLTADGFTGWIRISDLPRADVPSGAGVYVVVRENTLPPRFRATNPGGRASEKDPTVPVAELREAWVDGAEVLFVGRATRGVGKRQGLAKRLAELRRFGLGQTGNHWGGRYVWQLADSDDLLVAWKETGEADPEEVAAQLLARFEVDHGQLPFANLVRGSATATQLPQIRAARVEDIEEVVELWTRAGENRGRPADRPDLVRLLIERDPEALLLAVDDGVVVGSVIAGWDGWRASLYRLAVAPEHRRRGTARLLVGRAEARLKAFGASRIHAMVLEENQDGHGLWQALGYTPQPDWRRWVKATR